VIWLLLDIIKVLAACIGKETPTHCLPHLDNEHPWSVNDIWPCIMVDQSEMWPLLSMYNVLAGFIVQNAHEH